MEKKQQIIRFAFYFLLLLPLMLFRDLTPMNELKYLSIANESLADGHFFTMFNHGIAYADKPPLYIWIIMFFKWLLGYHSTFVLELFSLIPAFITIGIFNKWCGTQMGKKYIIASELALLTSAYFIGSAMVLRMDMLMTMFITLAMYTFYRMYTGDNRMRLKIAFPVYVFLAIFSKGPVGIMVPLFCIPAYLLINKKIKTIFKYWGWRTWLILALLCGTWFTFAYLEGGKEYINNLLFHQTIDRAVDAFHHKEPFYYYGYTIWYGIAPWSLLTIGVIIYALCKRLKMTELTKFMLCTAGVMILIMSIVSAKLVIYILPSFAFITYAAFMILEQLDNKKFAEVARKVVTYGAILELLILFVVGCLVSKYNYRIGYKEVSEEAQLIADKYGIDRFYYYDIRTGPSLDTFIEHPVEMLTEEQFNNPQSVIGESNGIIIFAKEDGIVRCKAVLKNN